MKLTRNVLPLTQWWTGVRKQHFAVDTNYVWYNFNRSMFDSVSLMKQSSDIKNWQKYWRVNKLERTAELAKLKPGLESSTITWQAGARQPLMFTVMGMVKIPLQNGPPKWIRQKLKVLFGKMKHCGTSNRWLLMKQAAWLITVSPNWNWKRSRWNCMKNRSSRHCDGIFKPCN